MKKRVKTPEWEYWYQKLLDWEKAHPRLPKKRKNPELHRWIQIQIRGWGWLTFVRLEKLASTKIFSKKNKRWIEKFLLIREKSRTYKSFRFRRKTKEDRGLSAWMTCQRMAKREGRMGPSKLQLLNRIEFPWGSPKGTREDYLARLEQFKSRFGHCNVPAKWKEDLALGYFLFSARAKRKRGRLDPVLYQRLDQLGFPWVLEISSFDRQFAELEKFKKLHGHCHPTLSNTKNKTLIHWVARMRIKKPFTEDQKRRLDEIGFIWDPHKREREQSMEKLKAFYREFGHCNVPTSYQDGALGKWVSGCRRNKDLLTPDELNALNSMGIDWNPLETHWMEKYNRLKQFFKEFGHSRMGTVSPGSDEMVKWMSIQRVARRKGKISAQRIKHLDKIKFDWSGKPG